MGARRSSSELSILRTGGAGRLAGLGAVTTLAVFGCSIVVNEDPTQCANDADCVRFQGTLCVNGGCVAGPPLPDAGGETNNLACSTTQDCLAIPGGQFSICRAQTCVPLLSLDCGAVYGNYETDGARFIGALIPLSPPHESTGLSIQSAIRLASEDFADGLPAGPSGAGFRPPLAIVVCDETEDPVRAATHLVQDIGVQAIVGATLTDATRAVAAVTNPAGVLLVSPTSGGTISDVNPDGLVRRTCPPDALEAQAMAQIVEQVFAPRVVTTPGAMMRVAVLNKTDTSGADLTASFLSDLSLNGYPALDAHNVGYLIAANYGDPDSNPNADVSGAIAMVTGPNAPDVVVLIGNTEAATELLSGIELTWPGGKRPYYLVSSGVIVPELLTATAANDAYTRTLGAEPGIDPEMNPLHPFVVRYEQSVNDGISDVHVFGTANAYDAVYLVGGAHAVLGLQGKPVTGPNLRDALAELTMNGTMPYDVGPALLMSSSGGPNDAPLTMAANGGIDLNGTSGPLDFDPVTFEVSSPVRILCPTMDPTTQMITFADSGMAYDGTTLGGTLSASCLP